MLPASHGNNPSTSYLPSQSTNNVSKHNLEWESNSDNSNKTADEILFQTLMNDPLKKAFLLNMLSQEKENIAKYKQQEGAIVTKTPLKQYKRTYCESPTALLRRRALEKNRDSDSSSTRSHSPVTPSTPVQFDKILKGVVAYVEIRSKDVDRSAGAKLLMESMGATVVDILNRKVTHVVFKDGSFSTYQKAKLLKVHLVSVLWLEAIRKCNARVPEKNYPALGIETYDVNVTAIYEDYENIVRDEHRRSLAISSQRGTLQSQKRSRLTALPGDLSSSLQRKSNRSNFSGRFSDVVPSSQEFEVDSSIMSFGSNRPNSATLVNPEEVIEMTSDDDSDCGVVDGHSASHLKDSLLSDLDSQLNLYQHSNNEHLERDDNSESSTSSMSLLTRKAISKTSTQLVDMDLTDNLPIPDKNLNSIRASSLNELQSIPLVKNLESVKQNLFSRKSNSKEDLESKKDSNSPSSGQLQLSQNSCVILSDICLQAPNTSRHTKSSEEMPTLRISTDSATRSLDRQSNSSSNADDLQNRKSKNRNTKSSEIMPSLRVSTDSITRSSKKQGNDSSNTDDLQNIKTGTRNTKSSEIMPSLRVSTDSITRSSEKQTRNSFNADDLQNTRSTTRNTKSSEIMPSLRVSADSVTGSSKKQGNNSSSTDDLENIKTRTRNTKSSEIIPSLRVSTDSVRHSSEKQTRNSLNGDDLQNTRSTTRNTKSSEIMPSLRVSTESITSSSKKQGNASSTDNLQSINITTCNKKSGEYLSTEKQTRNSLSADDPQNIKSKTRNTKSSETMPSLRVSTDSITRALKNHDDTSLTANQENIKSKNRNTKSSEIMPTLRISLDNNSNQSGVRTRSSDRLNRQFNNSVNIENVSFEMSENVPVKSNQSKLDVSDELSRSRSTRSTEGLQSLKTCIDSTSQNAIIRTRSLDRLSKKVKNTLITDSMPPPKASKESVQTNNKNNNTSKKFQPEVGVSKRLRKLFNVNQSITNTEEFEKMVEHQVVADCNTKRLVVPLPRIILSGNNKLNNKPLKKKEKNVIIFPIQTKTKKLNKKARLKNVIKSVRNLFPNKKNDKNNADRRNRDKSIRDHALQKRNKKREFRRSESESSNQSDDHSQSPPKRRCSLRIQDAQTQISSQLKNRRSTLEFVPPSTLKSQRTQKLKKVKTSIVCTRMHKPDVQMFCQIVKKLGGYFIEDEVSKRTSHLVVGENKRTINLLRAICRGCWILKNEWLLRSLEVGKWLPEEDYELTDFSPAVQQCRRERQVFGNLYSMDIFSDCDPIYVSRNSTPRRSDLEELIELCKGKVAKEIYHAKIMVGDWIRTDNIICVNEKWILDSITFNKKKSFKKYLITPTT